MTIQVAVIASGAKQSRVPDIVQINDFVIISAGHGINPLQKRLMTIQVAVIASGAKQSRSPDNVRINDFVIIRRCIELVVGEPVEPSKYTKQSRNTNVVLVTLLEEGEGI